MKILTTIKSLICALGAVAALCAAIAIASCGRSDSFKIDVEFPTVESDGQRIVMHYVNPRGMTSTVEATVAKGKARLTGEAPDFTIADILTAEGTPLARCIVHNGDGVRLSVAPGEAALQKVAGSEPTALYRQFTDSCAQLIASADTAALRPRVAAFVRENHSSPAAVAVMMDFLALGGNEALGDSLLDILDPQARPVEMLRNYGVINARRMESSKPERIYSFGAFTAADNAFTTIRPADSRRTLIAFTSGRRDRRSNQAMQLRAAARAADTVRSRVIEVSLATDSAAWRAMIAADSSRWVQAWVPGGTASPSLERFAVPREPFYVVVDSTGRQIYRGTDAARATAILAAGKLMQAD